MSLARSAHHHGAAAQSPLRVSDGLVIAAWGGLLFGLAEGILLCVARLIPSLRPSSKVSLDILWVAPITHATVFAVCVLIVVALRRYLPATRCAIGVVVFLGAFAAADTLGVLYRPSALVLAAGIAALVLVQTRGREQVLLGRLRNRFVVVPVVILAVVSGTLLWRSGRESFAVDALPKLERSAASVIFFVFDTVRRDALYDPRAAPNFHRLAKRGVLFDNVWTSTSWSLPSHATLLTGLYPSEHGATWPKLELRDDRATLPELLSKNGYVTASFSGNSSWVTPEHLGRGFHRFHVYTTEQIALRTTFGRGFVSKLLKPLGVRPGDRGHGHEQLSQQLLDFVDEYRGRPFFAYVTFMDVNRAYYNRRAGRFWKRPASMMEGRRAYYDGLRELDRAFAMLIAQLERRGALNNTVIVVVSDHGQSFGVAAGDHAQVGHGTSLYPEQTRVPLLVIYPKGLPAGTRVISTISTRSIARRVAALLRLREGEFAADGMSNTGLAGDGAALMTLDYANQNAEAVAWDGWQYVRSHVRQDSELLSIGSTEPPRFPALVAAKSTPRTTLTRARRGPFLVLQ